MLGMEIVVVIAIISYTNLAEENNDWYMVNNPIMWPLLRIQTFFKFFRHPPKSKFFEVFQMLDSERHLFKFRTIV